MSRETVQFVEIVRQAAASVVDRAAQDRKYPLYCDRCGHQTQHTLECRGDWEIYTCGCGMEQQYRVR